MASIRLVELAKRLYPELKLETKGAGIWVLQQWAPQDRPATPLERMGMALIDIGLEYVAVNPGMIGIGGNADKLIAGVAANLRELLPDPDDLSKPGNDFAEGAIRLFVQASLMTLNEQIDDTVEEESLRDLSKAILKPLIDAVAKDDTGTEHWYDIRDELLGPISEAAIGVVAKHQRELLGESFDPDKGLGAVTKSVLLAVKENGLSDDFGREGVLRIYRAALDVAIKQPDLFVGEIEINGQKTNIGQALLADTAKALRQNSPPFNRSLLIELVAASIDTVGRCTSDIFIFEGDWGFLATEAVRTAISEVSAGLVAGVRGQQKPEILARLFNQEQAHRFFKLFLNQAAANPGMIVGPDSAPEVRMLTTVVARAMAEQDKLLLSAEDWLLVVGTVSEEVARNPNRLIRLDADDPESQLAYKVISKLLHAAANDFEQVGRAGGSVMFGTTLAEAISDSINAAAGNAEKALNNTEALETLVDLLNRLNKSHPGRIGRREWRYLFRRFVAEVLDTGNIPEYKDEQLLGLLEDMPTETKRKKEKAS
jgi:hypothetical protein